MWNLRQIISQNRKRIGFVVCAGAPAGLSLIVGEPLIPAIKDLTEKVINGLPDLYGPAVTGICADLGGQAPNIELILSRVRALSSVLGEFKVHDLNGDGFRSLGTLICEGIGELVSKPLPPGENAYTQFVSWVVGASRASPVEIFTTNYDLLFETAFENSRNAYDRLGLVRRAGRGVRLSCCIPQ